jgi:hypothetical protein
MDGRLACHRDRLALLFAKPTTTTHRDRAAAAAAEQCHLALVCGGGGVDSAGLSEGAPVGHSPSSSASDMKETTELLPETRDNKIAATVETDLSSPAEIAASDTIRRRLWMQRVVNVRVAETEMKRAHVASVLKAAAKDEAARTWIPVHGRSNRSSTGSDAELGKGGEKHGRTRHGAGPEHVLVFFALVLGCAVLCCTPLFGKYAGGYSSNRAGRGTKPGPDATTTTSTAATCSGGGGCPAAVKIDAVSVPAPPLPLPRTPGAGKVESGTSVACWGGRKGCTAQPGTTRTGGHAFLRAWSTAAALSIITVAGVSVASVRFFAGGSLNSHGARRASSAHRRRRWWLRSAMVGLAVMSSEGAGVSAAACTASTCCNVVIPSLDPLTTTEIRGSAYQCAGSVAGASVLPGCGWCNQGP